MNLLNILIWYFFKYITRFEKVIGPLRKWSLMYLHVVSNEKEENIPLTCKEDLQSQEYFPLDILPSQSWKTNSPKLILNKVDNSVKKVLSQYGIVNVESTTLQDTHVQGPNHDAHSILMDFVLEDKPIIQ